MNNRINLFFEDMKNLILPAIVFFIYAISGIIINRSLCPSVVITGFPCPGCGLTRATVSILKGDFVTAWQYHPFIYGIIVFLIFVVIWRYILLKDRRAIINGLVILFIALIAFYVYRMIRYFPGESPMNYYPGNFLEKILNSGKRL